MAKFDTNALAPTVSPGFSGNPTAPTQSPGDNDTSLATTAFVKAAIDAALASIGANPFVTGDLMGTYSNAARSGWVLLGSPDAGTIGDATSGGTIRANVDCQALFTLLFTVGTDSTMPLQNSAGTVITRASQGNNAATAWGAHCRMSTPLVAGRVMGSAGSGAGLTARTPGSGVGAETETQTTSTLVGHSHVVQGNYVLAETYFGTTSGYAINQPNANTGVTGGGAAMNNMQPSQWSYWFMKL